MNSLEYIFLLNPQRWHAGVLYPLVLFHYLVLGTVLPPHLFLRTTVVNVLMASEKNYSSGAHSVFHTHWLMFVRLD